ncbi:porin family protein [Cytophagales bacterium LB-30]|uniref:Porin family protein n=1 Tax=Shiella aurantiaca TaxID=3058365 RepID=A0ABT8F9H6_9BACT|nr:porin family protein [Shiella aurantiaca]MDN4166938.1 porin family protein [Shiella aurantiaca]
MHTLNFWHKLHIYRKEVIVLALLCSSFLPARAQLSQEINLPNHDNRRIHYGAVFGLHSRSYNIRYSEAFVSDPSLNTLHSITPLKTTGLSAGFIFNFRFADNLDVKLNAQVGIYEYQVQYRYFDGANEIVDTQLQEPVNAEFPMLVKYKSQRRKNFRMYLVAGINPSIEASARNKREGVEEILLTKGINLSAEYGFGMDFYYPYFKFSPEIRFSNGLLNIIDQQNNKYSIGIERMVTNSVTLYFHFAG